MATMILVLKYVQNFIKIYKTLAGALTGVCVLCSLGPRPPPFDLPAIIHRSGRPAKNGEGLGAFIT